VAQLDRLLHLVAAQVQVAMFQPGLFTDLAVKAFDLEGRGLGLGQHLNLFDPHLELPGRQFRVDRLIRAGHHFTGDADHVFGTQGVTELVRSPGLIRVEDELDQAGPVAQVDEDQATVVTTAVDPAGKAHLASDLVPQDLATPGISIRIRFQLRRVAHRSASLSVLDPYLQ